MATADDSRVGLFVDGTGRGCSSCAVLTRWTWSAIAEALAETEGFRLAGGLAKMVGKVPRKFGERHRSVSKDLRPRAEGDYCAMYVMLSWMCVVVVLAGRAGDRQGFTANEGNYRNFRRSRR